uniref:Uncharacterized protein n=1 Tax=Globodera pallida TaxID=36090 RepID=A0A183CCR7_GLOPA
MFCFTFNGCAILLFTEAAIKVVPVSYYYYYNGQHPQQQFVQYANQQQKISNNRIQNSRVMNGNPKTDQWNTNPSPKDKDDAWDIKEQKMRQPKQQTEPISQNSIQKQQMQTDNYEPILSNQIQPNQRTDQYQPVFSNQFQQKQQQHTDQSKPDRAMYAQLLPNCHQLFEGASDNKPQHLSRDFIDSLRTYIKNNYQDVNDIFRAHNISKPIVVKIKGKDSAKNGGTEINLNIDSIKNINQIEGYGMENYDMRLEKIDKLIIMISKKISWISWSGGTRRIENASTKY